MKDIKIFLEKEKSGQYGQESSIQLGGYQNILPPGVFLGYGVLGKFGLKSYTRKTVKIYKDFKFY